MKSPKIVKEIQSSTRRAATLSQFFSLSFDKCKFFYSGIKKRQDLFGTNKCEESYSEEQKLVHYVSKALLESKTKYQKTSIVLPIIQSSLHEGVSATIHYAQLLLIIQSHRMGH